MNIDPLALDLALTQNTRGICVTHMYGKPCRMDAISDFAKAHDLRLIEDCAQSHGARFKDKWTGTFGDAGCFSFYPTKNLGGFGDGGLVTTRSPVLAETARLLRAHGARSKNHHTRIGCNFRLDALQAALLGVKLGGVDAGIARRAEHARAYDLAFAEAGLDEQLVLPRATGARPTWNQYVLRVKGAGRRDALRAFLAERRVGTEIYYPVPLHRQPCFQALGQEEGSLPVAEAAARETLALPVFPELAPAERDFVAAQILAFFQAGR